MNENSGTQRLSVAYTNLRKGDVVVTPERATVWVDRPTPEEPVPALPPEPFVMFRGHYEDGEHVLGFVLPETAPFSHASASGRPWATAVAGHGKLLRVEVLSEPRAVTAKAVLDRVVDEGVTTSDDAELLAIAAEFGVWS